MLAGCDDEGATGESGGGEASGNSGSSDGAKPVVSGQVLVHGSSYVSPLVEIFGDVFIGTESYMGPSTVLRAAPDLRVEFGNETNAQDNVRVRARAASSAVGDRTSLAHHAIVRDSKVGDFVFLGFGTEIVDSTYRRRLAHWLQDRRAG